MNNTQANQLGFTTLEILIAAFVLTTCLGAVILVVFGSQAILIDSQNSSTAEGLAQEVLARAQAQVMQDFDVLQNGSETQNLDGTIFDKDLSVSELDAVTKQITAQVSWPGPGSTKHVDLTAVVADPDSGPGADTCSFTSGDWKEPQVISSDFANLVGDPGGIYTITDVDAYLGKLYVSTNNSGGPKNQNDFFIFTLQDPASPQLLGAADNDPANATGINAVSAGGRYVYLASASSVVAGQLQILDVSAGPKVVATYKVPGVSAKAGQGAGNSIAYRDSSVYLGLTKPLAGPEFNVISVIDPTQPALAGSAAIGNGVNDIYVRDNYAYVASPNSDDLRIYDVAAGSLSASMAPSGSFDVPAGRNGKTVKAIGDKIFLGRTVGSNEFYLLDGADPAAIQELGHVDVGSSVNGLAIKGDFAFFLTTSNLFEVWDLANPKAPALIASSSLAAQDSGKALDCEGNYFYAASNDATGHGLLSVITAP